MLVGDKILVIGLMESVPFTYSLGLGDVGLLNASPGSYLVDSDTLAVIWGNLMLGDPDSEPLLGM